MIRNCILLSFVFLNSLTLIAQNGILSKTYKTQSIQRLSELMNSHYVFPDVAKQTEKHLLAQLKSGYYDGFTTNESFAEALTKSVQEINHDKHMRIRQNTPYQAPENTPERLVEEKLDQMDWLRRFNSGFNTVKLLEDNVGYLDLRAFAHLESGKATADAYMALLANCDALIIDLSKNGGGDPHMVQYLCSYFFNEKLLLNSLYWRMGDETQEFWTLDKVDGDKMPDLPLVVITSERTFSGAEEFSYNMQTRKRAVLVGQTSGGGANPGGMQEINDQLSVFIPTGKAINPITKTNWEGVGVIPDIKTSPENTYNKAVELAKKAGEEFRNQRKKTFGTMYLELNTILNQDAQNTSENTIFNALKKCSDAHFLNEGDINRLGYQYLMEYNKPLTAEHIFKANMLLYPNSANAIDSYAEALMNKGELTSALKYYQKAVKLAQKNKDRDLQLFQNNLTNLKNKLDKK